PPRRPPPPPPFPYTTLFRSPAAVVDRDPLGVAHESLAERAAGAEELGMRRRRREHGGASGGCERGDRPRAVEEQGAQRGTPGHQDRKSTRLNSSHVAISYAV